MGKLLAEVSTYSRDQGLDTLIAYGTSGNANGLQEYIGYAFPGAATSAARWKILKLGYDSSGRQTAQRHANGSDEYTLVWDSRTSYQYLGL